MPDTTNETSIDEILVSRKVILSVQDGVTASGATKLKNRSYNNISEDASAEGMHATALAFASLMKNDLAHVYYDDKKLLEEVENA